MATLDKEWLRTGPYEQVRKALLALPGVGTFTAHALLLRVLGRPEGVPLEMAQFEDTARAVYGDPPPSPAELREAYGPSIGWWAYYVRTARSWQPEDALAAASRTHPEVATGGLLLHNKIFQDRDLGYRSPSC